MAIPVQKLIPEETDCLIPIPKILYCLMSYAVKAESSIKVGATRWQILTRKVQEHRLEEVWRRFEDAGFKPLLIKGWAAAQYYTDPAERQFDDFDLIINPPAYSAAVDFLKDYKGDSSIDLHKGARHLDRLSFEDLYARSKISDCERAKIRVLCPEDHLRVLAVHWLTDGGAKKEKLWDIFYLVQNRSADFDWDRGLNAAGETRRKWIACTIRLAHRYLGLDIKDIPLNSSDEIPSWLIEALEREWASGVRLRPLHQCLFDGKEFWRQIKKRMPPNPIQATIEQEGEFDERPRVIYQIGNIFTRLKPSVGRISEKFLNR